MNSAIIINTRFTLLGYTCEAPGQWSIVDLTTLGHIGPKYTSKDELLADIGNFAETRGYA